MKHLLALALVPILTACALKAPPYAVSINNVQALETIRPVNLGEFKVANPSLDSIAMRGSQLSAPVNGGYAEYLKQALAQELDIAHKLDPNSKTTVSAELLENDLNSNSGQGRIKARFVVSRDKNQTFRKEMTANNEWQTSFAAAIALPEAANNYPILVQKLLAELFNDSDFQAATK